MADKRLLPDGVEVMALGLLGIGLLSDEETNIEADEESLEDEPGIVPLKLVGLELLKDEDPAALVLDDGWLTAVVTVAVPYIVEPGAVTVPYMIEPAWVVVTCSVCVGPLTVTLRLWVCVAVAVAVET